MNITGKQPERRGVNPGRIIGWGGAVALVLTPLVAMQFTTEVNWDEADFIVATIIFGIVGGLIELAVRLSSNWYFRFGAMFAVLSGLMVVWSNLAVGMIGNEENPMNLWFGAVLLIAVAGSIASRFHRSILPYAMAAAGLAQASVGLIAGVLGADPRGGLFTILLAFLWFIAGGLFQKASKRELDL